MLIIANSCNRIIMFYSYCFLQTWKKHIPLAAVGTWWVLQSHLSVTCKYGNLKSEMLYNMQKV